MGGGGGRRRERRGREEKRKAGRNFPQADGNEMGGRKGEDLME